MDSMADHTSKLPGPILQHIMSFLPAEDAARTSVLSKTWQNAWILLPAFTFDFDEDDFTGVVKYLYRFRKRKKSLQKERHEFMKRVNESTKALHQHKAVIEKFRLSMTFGGQTKTATFINRCIALATRNCVRELYLDLVPSTRKNVWHILPRAAFAARSLVVLKLKGFKLEGTLFAGNNAQFKNLKKLSLVRVHLDEQTLESLINMLPFLENFTIRGTSGLKHLRIPNLPNLKKVRVNQPEWPEFKTVEIEAQHLQSFCYFASCVSLDIGMFRSLRYLKDLTLEATSITDESFNGLVSALPLLECLLLKFCLKLERAKIWSPLLRKLSLRTYKGLLEAKIDAPNLISFTYGGGNVPVRFDIDAPTLVETNLSLIVGRLRDTSWFVSLREYLLNFNEHNDCRVVFDSRSVKPTNCNVIFHPEEVKEFSLPGVFGVVKHLTVEDGVPFSSSSVSSPGRHEMMLRGLLWCCRPDYITMEPWQSGGELSQLPGALKSIKKVDPDSSASVPHSLPKVCFELQW